MMKTYKGDTFSFKYKCEMLNKEIYEFKQGEQIKIIIYESLNKNNFINKIIEINENTKEINIVFECETMKNLKSGLYTIEIKLINKSGTFTTFQDKLTILESWCNNE